MESLTRTAQIRQAAFDVPVPQATRTYGPVSNQQLYHEVTSRLTSQGYNITDEQWSLSHKGQVTLCKLHIGTNDDMNLKRTFAFMNSYNKLRSISFASGAVVAVCTNGMFWGDETNFRRRHHRNIWDEIYQAVDSQLVTMNDNYNKLRQFKTQSEQDIVRHNNIAALAGRLYFDDILTPRMLSTLRKELSDSENFKFGVDDNGRYIPGSVWSFYNNCTEALKRANAMEYINRHSRLTEHLTAVRGYRLN